MAQSRYKGISAKASRRYAVQAAACQGLRLPHQQRARAEGVLLVTKHRRRMLVVARDCSGSFTSFGSPSAQPTGCQINTHDQYNHHDHRPQPWLLFPSPLPPQPYPHSRNPAYSANPQSGSSTQELLASYNIGVDRQARQREDIQRSAQRAGLQLPPAWDADQTQAGSQALHKNKPA